MSNVILNTLPPQTIKVNEYTFKCGPFIIEQELFQHRSPMWVKRSPTWKCSLVTKVQKAFNCNSCVTRGAKDPAEALRLSKLSLDVQITCKKAELASLQNEIDSLNVFLAD